MSSTTLESELGDSSRLFQDSRNDVQIVHSRVGSTKKAPDSLIVTSADSLISFFEESEEHNRRYIYTIRQEYSWDRLLVTRDVLLAILGHHNVFSKFLDCVRAFGARENDDDEAWEGHHRSINEIPDVGEWFVFYEFCYTFRYMAKNGRTSGSPWSLRQTGVYQKFDSRTGSSTWILLQPSALAAKRFENIDEAFPPLQDLMYPHMVLLSVASKDWKEYIAYLHQSLRLLDEKACFSRVGKLHLHDYPVTFSDGQDLQGLQRKFFRTLVVLESTIGILNSCRSHSEDLRSRGISISSRTIYEMESLDANLSYHKRVVASLLEYSKGTANLLNKIKERRDDEILYQCNQALKTDVALMRSIAATAKDENDRLIRITEQTRRDSKSLKALTIVATMYLPASLVANIFNSSLIQAHPADQSLSVTRLSIAPEIWIYFTVTVPLVFITMVYSYWLERRSLR